MKVKLDDGAIMPTRAHETDAGLDLYSRELGLIPPHCSCWFDTGVHVQLPSGTVGFVKSRSGLMFNCDVTTDGTVDEGYIGSIRVKLFNHSDTTVEITPSERIAQLVIVPVDRPHLVQVDHLEDSDRGTGGFGSTGK